MQGSLSENLAQPHVQVYTHPLPDKPCSLPKQNQEERKGTLNGFSGPLLGIQNFSNIFKGINFFL